MQNLSNNILHLIEKINTFINGIVWGPIMLIIMVGLGIYLTIRLGFFQVTHFGRVMKTALGGIFEKKNNKKGTISPFQAMTTALAGTLGTGNIVGVATAIVQGGPGAVFWMWISAFFGMMTKYAEILLSVKYRDTNAKGEYVGGPMYYIEKGLKQKWLAVVFAILCLLASFGIGNMSQANSAVSALAEVVSIDPLILAIVIAVLAGLVMLGGIKRIGSVTEKFIPFMAIFYIVAGAIVLFMNFKEIPQAIRLIFTYAFQFRSVAGGISGYIMAKAIKYGVSRGVFSNEAGLGSAPIAYAAADTNDAAKQGLWGIFEVFFDTIVMCTMTALIILTSGLWDSGAEGAALTLSAFQSALGSNASIIIAISTAFFAFSTILSWSYYGEKSLEYLTKSAKAIVIYKFIFIAMIIVGSVSSITLVWDISDTLNGMMAIPNLIAVIILSPQVIRMVREYTMHNKIERLKKYSITRKKQDKD